MKKLRILVFGAGAIGTYVGGSLARMGHQVVFVEQPQVVEELRLQGLRLRLAKTEGSETEPIVLHPSSSSVAFEPSISSALEHAPFDVAIFALKSFDTEMALQSMLPYAVQIPPVLCLQNGVDNEPAIAAILGSDKVIAGTVTSSVGRQAAGDIVLERLRGVGLSSTHTLSDRLFAALSEAGVNPQLFPRAADMKWSKMLTNLPANASAAILDMTAAEVFAHPGLFRLETRMLLEALSVMKAHGITVVDLPGAPVRALALGTRLPEFISRPLLRKAIGGGRGGKMPSFHIDLHSGRGKSEVEWLNGAVVRYGEQAGISTPVNKLLTETLVALTRGDIPVETCSRQPEKLLAKF